MGAFELCPEERKDNWIRGWGPSRKHPNPIQARRPSDLTPMPGRAASGAWSLRGCKLGGDGQGDRRRAKQVKAFAGGWEDDAGGVKYGFTSPPSSRVFLRVLYLLASGYACSNLSFCVYVCVSMPVNTYDVIHTSTTPIMRGCRGSFVRKGRLAGQQGAEGRWSVLLVFYLHRHIRRQLFVSVHQPI